MGKINKKTFKAVDNIIKECKEIEKSDRTNESYRKLIEVIGGSFFPGMDYKPVLDEAIDKEGDIDSVYHYYIAIMLKKAHSSAPDYKGKDERESKIDNFVTESLHELYLND